MELKVLDSEKRITIKDLENVESLLNLTLPEVLREFYLHHNGGTIDKKITMLNEENIEIESIFPIKYVKDFNDDPDFTAEGETIKMHKAFAIPPNMFIFGMESEDEGRIAVDLKDNDNKVYLYPITGMAGDIFVFGKPTLISTSINVFFAKLESGINKQSKEIEAPLIYKKDDNSKQIVSDNWPSITKRDIEDLELKLKIEIPQSMKLFYLKNNGGIPSNNLFIPQNKKLDVVEINLFLPIKYDDCNTKSISTNTIDCWEHKTLPLGFVPFAIDSGGNFYSINVSNKKIYYCLMDQWDNKKTNEMNYKHNIVQVAQSFKYFVDNLFSEL